MMFEKLITKLKTIPVATMPIVFVMAILPLIVHYYEFEAHLSTMSWYVSNDITGDMFNYYKSEYLVATVGVMIMVIIVAVIFSKRFYFSKILIPLAVYALFIILSTMCSDYQYFSLNGMDGHFETVYVLLSYCMLVLFSYWFADAKGSVKFILYMWLIGIAVIGVIGLFQVAEHDLFLTEFGKFFIVPKELRDTMEITLTMAIGKAYLTLYNPNYVGFYAVLTIPILTTLFIFVKNKFIKAVSFILNCIIFVCLLGSGAKNGMIALAVALVVMLIVFRKNLKVKWLSFGIAYVSMIVIFIVFNAVKGGMVTNSLEVGFTVEKDTSEKLEAIETNEDNVVVCYDGNELAITLNITQTEMLLGLKDQDDKDVSMRRADNDSILLYEITDERFPFEIQVGQVDGVYGFSINIEEKYWTFSNQTGYKGYFFYSPYGQFTKIEEAESVIFTNYSHLASGRGYLWARTIPLLKDYLLIGSGPDTFTVVFPQKDYVAASKMGYDKLTVTKPHNLYLQIGVQTGVVSLIAFLSFNLMYLWECLKRYWKKTPDSFLEYVGISIMIAVIGYLISGIINDSTITVAPVYWCLMGLGLAVNRLVKIEREELEGGGMDAVK